MKLMDQYLGRAVLTGTALVMTVLLAINLFVSFISELDSLGRGNYELLQITVYVCSLLPQRAYEVFPVAGLLGSLLGLGMLAGNSELMIWRASGVSIGRMALSVARAGLLLGAIAVVIGNVLAPGAQAYGAEVKAVARSGGASRFWGQLWLRHNNQVINVGRLVATDQLLNVTVYMLDDQGKLLSVDRAQKATFKEGQWHFNNLVQSILGDEQVTVKRTASTDWKTDLKPEVFDLYVTKPEYFSFSELYRYIGYLTDNGLDTGLYSVALWSKVIAPVAVVMMCLLAIPFVFGSLRMVGAGQRMLVGVLIGLSYFIINLTFSSSGQVFGIAPFVSATLPTLVLGLITIGAIRRVG